MSRVAKPFPRPLARIPVAVNRRHPIGLQQRSKLSRNVVRAERRPPFAHRVDHHDLTLPVANSQGHGVGGATRWIDKTHVIFVGRRRPLARPSRNAGHDRLDGDVALDVRPKFGVVFCGRAGRIGLKRLLDHPRGNARVHHQRRRPPDQNRRVVLAVVASIRIPQRAPPRVRRAGADQQESGIVSIAGRIAAMISAPLIEASSLGKNASSSTKAARNAVTPHRMARSDHLDASRRPQARWRRPCR